MYIGIVYKYLSPSNKVYIGLTLNEKKRKIDFFYMKDLYAGPKLENARKKYGPELFTYEILYKVYGNDKKELRGIINDREKYFISYYGSIKNGYNTDFGGHYVDSIHHTCWSEERKVQFSKYMKLLWRTGQFKGKLTTLSIASIKDKLSIPILLYDREGCFVAEWRSSHHAAEALGIKATSVNKVCLGYLYMYKNYIYVYKKDYPNMPLKIDISYIPKKYLNLEIHHGSRHKTVYLLDLNGNLIKVFYSVLLAAQELDITKSLAYDLVWGRKLPNEYILTYNYNGNE